MKKKIAVVGGGIFGVSIAIQLSKNNTVDLYEEKNDILSATSAINQYRLHRGYHYPRSKSTALSCIKSESEFTNEYKEAVMSNHDSYYAIAKEGSLTSASDYLNFCKELNLPFTLTADPLIDKNKIDVCIKVKENLFDISLLKKLCWEKLLENKVNVHLNTKADSNIGNEYDFTIIATYSTINDFLKDDPTSQKTYQYELCEKPVVALPSQFKNKSIIIMDGPFMCVDPFGHNENMFVLGNVTHAIHESNVGKYPHISDTYIPLLNNGIIKDSPLSKFKEFIDSGSEYIPLLKEARHIGSMYTIRTVLPDKESTDERPTIITRNNTIISVFSGKISTCVDAANQVTEMVENI